jgi:hypothetical protein
MPFLWHIRLTAAAEGVRHSTVDPSSWPSSDTGVGYRKVFGPGPDNENGYDWTQRLPAPDQPSREPLLRLSIRASDRPSHPRRPLPTLSHRPVRHVPRQASQLKSSGRHVPLSCNTSISGSRSSGCSPYSVPPCIDVSSVDDTNLRFCCLYFRSACKDQVSHKTYIKRMIFIRAQNKNSTRYTKLLPCRQNQPNIFSGV